MKRDRLLTMNECLAKAYGDISYVKPPSDNARRTRVGAAEEMRCNSKPGHCRCDRWGHACEDSEHVQL